jgi:hypothetical protein
VPDLIIAVKPHPTNPGQGFAKIRTEVGELEAWTPDFAKVEPLNGKPIPEGWSLRDNKSGRGKVLLPPREGGGSSFRNTREAFELEARSRERWQLLEEERKDRRTAAMTAFEQATETTPATETLELADRIYDWLRAEISPRDTGEGSPASGSGGGRAENPVAVGSDQDGRAVGKPPPDPQPDGSPFPDELWPEEPSR